MTLAPDSFVGDSAPVGDPHGRAYTPDDLAHAAVERVGALLGFSPSVVVEPSAGGGAFVRAARERWPDALLIGVDLLATAEGLDACDVAHVGDWTDPGLSLFTRPELTIGNPPFTEGVAVDHVGAALSRGGALALVLPWSFFGGVKRWDRLHGEWRPHQVIPITPRPWGHLVRETALYVWLPGPRPAVTLVTEPIRWKR